MKLFDILPKKSIRFFYVLTIMLPLASQIDFTGSTYLATPAKSALTIGTTVTISGLIRPLNNFLSVDHE